MDMTDNSNTSNKFNFGVKHYRVKIVRKKTSVIKNIISVISYAIFIWLLLIGITLLIYVADVKIRAMKGDNTPPNFNAYVVLTGSMIPDIMPKDVIFTKKVDIEDIEVGDVITFVSSDNRFTGSIITHRVVDIIHEEGTDKYKFQTKGDNNNVADLALVEDYNVLGRVFFKIPKVGYIQDFLATQGGWIIVILIPCLAVLSYDIMKLFKAIGTKGSKKKIKSRMIL